MRKHSARLFGATLLLLFLAAPSVVTAQVCSDMDAYCPGGRSGKRVKSSPGDTTFASRTLNLDKGGLLIMAGPAIRPGTLEFGPSTGVSILNLSLDAFGVDESVRVTTLGLGLRYGVKSDIELGLRLPTIALSEADDRIGDNMSLSATFQKRNDSGEVGARLSLGVPLRDTSDLGFLLETPLVLHAGGGAVLFDLVPGLSVTLADELVAGWILPARLVINVNNEFFIGAKSGFAASRFKDAPIGVPVGLLAGYAIRASESALIDVTAGFDWPTLVVFQDGESASLPDFYVLGFGVNVQFN